MTAIKKYWREFVCVFLGSMVVYFIFRMSLGLPDTSFGRFLFFAAAAGDLFALWYLLRELWRRKWSVAVSKLMERLIRGASRFIIRIMERWNIGGGKDGAVLRAKSAVTFEGFGDAPERRARRKRQSWKRAQSDRERLGFIYGYVVRKRIKEGVRVRSSDTPRDVSFKGENTPSEQKLFELYIKTRYDERADLDAQTVQRLKEQIIDRKGADE